MAGNPSSYIKAINKEAVHRICSGQVVLNLATAVKELVENSLDAGATVVEVRLREYGSELCEVTDNGCGVEPNNFQGLTLKHHTSKLQDFSDLVSVETFGFRGEALSSLCSLCDLTVTTRHTSANCGTRLVFDHNGVIVSNVAVARQVGTTVCLENIFSTLPVRQKEFHKNLKREFSKMSQLVYAYCLISTGVKISCTNHTKKGGRMVVAATQGCKSVRENIACIFGAKQLTNLLEVKMVEPSLEVLEQLNIGSDLTQCFQLEGFVSSCAHGAGRSTGDRQFYFINSRPCEPTKVMKAVNEVYRQFNSHQQPFVFLNVSLARDSVDVNVTPDKRQVFIEHEKLLVATVKASLQALYENIPSTYTINNSSTPTAQKLSSPSPLSQTSPAAILSQWRHSSSTKRPSDQPTGKVSKQPKLDSMFTKKEKTAAFLRELANSGHFSTQGGDNSKSSLILDSFETHNNLLNDRTQEEVFSGFGKKNSEEVCNNERSINIVESQVDVEASRTSSDVEHFKFEVLQGKLSEEIDSSQTSSLSGPNVLTSQSSASESQFSQPLGVFARFSQSSSVSDLETNVRETSSDPISTDDPSCNNLASTFANICDDLEKDDSKTLESNVQFDTDSVHNNQRRQVEVSLTMESLREQVKKSKVENSCEESRVKFRTVIDPSKNKQAEDELSREISKDMFSKMEVVGQFNLGFIIARLNADLFIVDQHASDEKYNFETLQATTTISSQKLVVPQQLDLTAVNETILADNINIFKANGFDFKINENAPTTTKVKLTSIPMSRNWIFGKEDIDELLFMLQDAPNSLCRPSRVRAMFASRACRKSVMIGTALSVVDMKRLLNHMGEIEQPWNCPHGRPTMRHLINLDFL